MNLNSKMVMNLKSIVNGSGLYWILYFVTQNLYIYFFFFGVEKKRENWNLVSIVLAAWPSGKAGDCKSFFPSSNPGAASTTDSIITNVGKDS